MYYAWYSQGLQVSLKTGAFFKAFEKPNAFAALCTADGCRREWPEKINP
jgi:hypothetical protein